MERKYMFVSILVLGALALIFGGTALNSVTRGYSNDVAAQRIQAEAERARAQAEMWQGRASAFQGEAERWRGFALSAQALTDPLRAGAEVLGAVALVIIAIGGTRVLWGLGSSGEAYIKVRTEVTKAQALLVMRPQRFLTAPSTTAYERAGFATREEFLQSKHADQLTPTGGG